MRSLSPRSNRCLTWAGQAVRHQAPTQEFHESHPAGKRTPAARKDGLHHPAGPKGGDDEPGDRGRAPPWGPSELSAKAGPLAPRTWTLAASGRGRIIADRQRLTQAVMQLAQNATQHTADGDEITLGSAVENGEARFWVATQVPAFASRTRSASSSASHAGVTAGGAPRAPAWDSPSSRPSPRRTMGASSCSAGPAPAPPSPWSSPSTSPNLSSTTPSGRRDTGEPDPDRGRCRQPPTVPRVLRRRSTGPTARHSRSPATDHLR